MGGSLSSSWTLRLADLPADRPTEFDVTLAAPERDALAAKLGLRALRKARFAGTLAPLGTSDWQLSATLGATVVQDCVVTLDPVTTRIDEPVTRLYLAEMPELPEGDEVEMPEDDSQEPLPDLLDLSDVLGEALALAVPDFPRAPGVDLGVLRAAEPGTDPMQDDEAKPFANLKDLLNKS